MITSVLEAVPAHPEIKEVALHVHATNEDAQDFYRRVGFEKGELVERYYRGLTPPDAYIFRKRFKTTAAASTTGKH